MALIQENAIPFPIVEEEADDGLAQTTARRIKQCRARAAQYLDEANVLAGAASKLVERLLLTSPSKRHKRAVIRLQIKVMKGKHAKKLEAVNSNIATAEELEEEVDEASDESDEAQEESDETQEESSGSEQGASVSEHNLHEDEEKRKDMDGKFYTKAQFVAFYGNAERWDDPDYFCSDDEDLTPYDSRRNLEEENAEVDAFGETLSSPPLSPSAALPGAPAAQLNPTASIQHRSLMEGVKTFDRTSLKSHDKPCTQTR